MLVSVIIPVYNVEKYLRKCLDSVINQTYKELEIILVDDGSTDSSGKICDEYAQKDNRIKVIHKSNGGLSDARNVGIEKSNGEYICFIDSDDYIELDMFENLYKACIEKNVKIASCDKIRELENGKKIIEKRYEESRIITKKEAYSNILLFDPAVCDKMFEKSLFANVRFPKGKLYEDILTTNKLVEQCDYLYHVAKPFYHYIQRNNSIVHQKFNIKKLDYIKNAKKLYEYIMKSYPELKEQCDAYYSLVLCTILCDIYGDRKKFKKEYKEYLNELKKYKKIINNNYYITKSKKIMIKLINNNLIYIVIFIKRIRNIMKYR